jgi:pyrroline-5-carboxylate reductase
VSTSTTFIGGGNMATALIKGLLENGRPPKEISVVELNEEARGRLHETFGVQACGSVDELPPDHSRVVVWAVKPQVLRTAVRQAQALRSALHVSIAAGIRAASLCEWLGTQRVVRAMPNTAAMVNRSVTGLYAASDAVSADDRELIESLMTGIGGFFWVQNDESMDAVTAVSGSGPAYVFHFLEGLQAAAVNLGFDQAQARRLALLTFEGAVQQALQTEDSFSLLRERVTSKGGTTAAALEVFNAHKTNEVTIAAVNAAFKRAQELAHQLDAAEI